ncbi:hypothetical protein JXQ70_05850 [bacterium]|nr:hypothetical protein [bacterium]
MAFFTLKLSNKFLIFLLSFIMFIIGYIFADITISINMKCNNNIKVIKYFKRISHGLGEIDNIEDLREYNRNFNLIITQLTHDYCPKEISDKMLIDKLDSIAHEKSD